MNITSPKSITKDIREIDKINLKSKKNQLKLEITSMKLDDCMSKLFKNTNTIFDSNTQLIHEFGCNDDSFIEK